MDVLGFLGGVIGGLLDLGAAAARTAVGAVLTFVGGVIDTLARAAAAVLELLPDAGDLGLEVPAGFIQGWSIFDQFLPLHETFAMLAVLVVASLLPIGWHLGITIYHLIPKPFSGT